MTITSLWCCVLRISKKVLHEKPFYLKMLDIKQMFTERSSERASKRVKPSASQDVVDLSNDVVVQPMREKVYTVDSKYNEETINEICNKNEVIRTFWNGLVDRTIDKFRIIVDIASARRKDVLEAKKYITKTKYKDTSNHFVYRCKYLNYNIYY